MASPLVMTSTRFRSRIVHFGNAKCSQQRLQSSSIVSRTANNDSKGTIPKGICAELIAPSFSPLARLSTSSLIRNIFLSSFFKSPYLFRPGLALFQKIAHSTSPWLNPDRNLLFRGIINLLVYKQFCAGRNKAEILQTSLLTRRLGFSGIVLCYGKEAQVRVDKKFLGQDDEIHLNSMDAEIDQWRGGNIQTLNMIREGDWLGIKYSGAGLNITNALMRGSKAPSNFVDAMQRICETAAARGCRIWIDAEQQVLQATIDEWTFDMMRHFNKTGQRTLIYNTVQAYLKSSRDKIQHQLALSQKEGWRLGIKLVRGAYISDDIREKIHDTKADTDGSYDGIVRDLLEGNFPALSGDQPPQYDLVLAGHNSESIRRTVRLASDLAAGSKLKVHPEFAQLQGMADDIGCEILQYADNVKADRSLPPAATYSPRVYKCLTWGSLQECMQYLTRRLVENRGAADRTKGGSAAFWEELKRRIVGRFSRST